MLVALAVFLSGFVNLHVWPAGKGWKSSLRGASYQMTQSQKLAVLNLEPLILVLVCSCQRGLCPGLSSLSLRRSCLPSSSVASQSPCQRKQSLLDRQGGTC